jgi:hypothetical protein
MTTKKTAQLELTGGIPTGEAHGTHIVTSGEVIEIPKAPPPQEPLTPQCKTYEQEQTEALQAPFAPKDIQWLPQRTGATQRGPWCMVSAYVDARALQERLDLVFGVFGWSDTYTVTSGGIICTLSVQWGGGLVSKSNGAEPTQIEAFKGGISTAFKRVCASGFGIGRYLYNVDTMFTDATWDKPKGSRESLKTDGWHEAKMGKGEHNGQKFYWQEPRLPNWALPPEHQVADDGKPMKRPIEGEPAELATPYDVRELYQAMKQRGMMEEDQQELLWSVGGVKSRRELAADMVPIMHASIATWQAPEPTSEEQEHELPLEPAQ